MFRLCNGKAALEVLDSCREKTKEENDLIRHNIVVFSDGQKALQVLPPLVDIIPEARLNLAIYYLNHGEIDAAEELMEDFDADSSQLHVIMAILNTEIGQSKGSPKAIAKAQSHFQSVGDSSNECDTIPGWQCMASSLYLQKQFDDAIVYLDSIKAYLGMLAITHCIVCYINILLMKITANLSYAYLQGKTTTSIGITGCHLLQAATSKMG